MKVFLTFLTLASFSLQGCGDKKSDNKSDTNESNASTDSDETFEPLDLTTAQLSDVTKTNKSLNKVIAAAEDFLHKAKEKCSAALEIRQDLIEKMPDIDDKTQLAANLAVLNQLISDRQQEVKTHNESLNRLRDAVAKAEAALKIGGPIPAEEYKKKRADLTNAIKELRNQLKQAEDALKAAGDNLSTSVAQYNQAETKARELKDKLDAKIVERAALDKNQKSKAKTKDDPVLKQKLKDAKDALATQEKPLTDKIAELRKRIVPLAERKAEVQLQIANDTAAVKLEIPSMPAGCGLLGVKEPEVAATTAQ